VFLGAALLFALEPMFVKMALPLFGGSPAVWNTAFVFFTTVLLLGYLYAHALVRLDVRRQLLVHASVLLAAVIVLPVGVAQGPPPALADVPSLGLFVLLFERIGLPFFALSATAPLVQSWFARGGARDPYRLYAASNVGSVIALLAYPFLIEPYTGLALQSRAWTFGYGAFAVLALVVGASAVRKPESTVAAAVEGPLLSRAIAWRARCLWMALAAVPVVLMTGLTAHLSTEIAPIPFVWALPLALYLLSFAVAFARLRPLSPAMLARLVPFAVIPVVVLLALHQKVSLEAYVALFLLMFFVLALALNARLATSRPAPEHLTEFYLWVAVGGAAGGALGVLVAPRVFTNIGEFPLAIVLACLLVPASATSEPDSLRAWFADVALPLGVLAAIALLVRFAPLDGAASVATLLLWLALGAGICTLFFGRPVRFAVAVSCLLLLGVFAPDPNGLVIGRERNFFGPKRIFVDPAGQYHFLLSGGTVHGVQALDPARSAEPLGYYSTSGPLGDVFAAAQPRLAGANVALVGLGVGSTACYRTAGQSWTFYEIDPAVVAMARDPRYFTLLASCAPDARIVLGDARLSLAREPAPIYTLIVLDAYNSDQVPVHLVTREAVQIYLHRLAGDGILAFHISNRHFDLEPVLAAIADDAGLDALERVDHGLSNADLRAGKMASSWIVMTRRGRMPEGLSRNERWGRLSHDEALPLWTDDYSSLLRVLRR
jgi:hypothetical protein